MGSHIETSSRIRFTIQVSMLKTEQNFPISRRELESGSCVDLRVCGRHSGSWRYMLPCTIYSILAVTLFQPRTIGFSDCVLSRLGNILLRDMKFDDWADKFSEDEM